MLYTPRRERHPITTVPRDFGRAELNPLTARFGRPLWMNAAAVTTVTG